MRVLTKRSTAHCDIDMYVRYLLSEPHRTSCTGLAEILPDVSHDSINRFLLRENYTPADLNQELGHKIHRIGGVISIDDMVIDKPYTEAKNSYLIGYFYSGKHHRVVKGLNLVTLYYTDPNDICVPINFRIVEPNGKKTKNEHFREMLQESLEWGYRPKWVTGDSWYSSIENLKFIRKCELGMLFGIDSNRIISVEKGSYCQVQALKNWSHAGKLVYLKGFGQVQVFRRECKNSLRYYMVSVPNKKNLDSFDSENFKSVHSAHWNIERFHRAAKQLCSIEKFQVRKSSSVKNHIFCSILGFIQLELARAQSFITNWYQVKKDLYIDIIRDFIQKRTLPLEHANLRHHVNA